MALETKVTLNDSTIDALNGLIRINRDSAEGFATAAETVENAQMAGYFRECADTRQRFAKELSRAVEAAGGHVVDGGTAKGAVHRWWLELRGSMQGGELKPVLQEAERGEDAIKHAYEDALKETAGSAMNDVLTRQYASVKRIHDRVRDMRDAL